MSLPKEFGGVPPIVQQLIETVASQNSWKTSRHNAKQTLIVIRDCINWALQRYGEEGTDLSKKRR